MHPSWTSLHALWWSENKLIENLKHWGDEINGPSSYCQQDFNFDHFTPLFHKQGPRNVLKWKTHALGVHSVQKALSVLIIYVFFLFCSLNRKMSDVLVPVAVVKNQWLNWFNEEKLSCCTCDTLFGVINWPSLPNVHVTFSYFRFWRQRKFTAGNLSFFVFTGTSFLPSKRKCCTSPILCNLTNKE